MLKRVKVLSAVCMGVFSMFTLIQKETLKMPTAVDDSNVVVPRGNTVGNPDEGIILFSLYSELFES